MRLQGQQAGGQTPGGQPPPTADPYANNAAAGALKFRWRLPPARIPAQSQPRCLMQSIKGIIDEKSWKYGHAFDATPNGKIWNPVKLKMMRGEKITGGTFFASSDPSTYCAFANAGYDFIWTEMQHNTRELGERSQNVAGVPARQRRSPVSGWPTRMNARFSMPWMLAR